ncbi:MAG: ABC transporter permease [Xanthomonadales bacterium]|nr:ABC transporter permease [Xanthomonadales bacterium]
MSSSANLIALETIVRRELVRIMRLWVQTLIPPAITMTLYFAIFGRLIGDRIGTFDDGFTYMQYIVPGLVMMSIITSSYGNTSSSFFFIRFNRAVEEMLVSPMPNWAIVLGYVIGSVMRSVAVGTIVLLISLLFTSLHIAHPLIAFVSALLGATIFSLIGFINALYAKTLDDIGYVSTYVLTPLAYLGGVFYPVSMLDQPWQGVSQINPILHMIDAFRCGVLGVGDLNIGIAFVVMLALVAGLSIIALILLGRGVGTRS